MRPTTLEKRVRLPLVLVVCSLLGLAILTGGAGAHAGLETTSPGDGEHVETMPGELELVFSGDGLQLAEVTVTGPDGDRVDGDATVSSRRGNVVSVPVDRAGDGVYTVNWQVVSNDGHEVTGAYFFAVGGEELDRERILSLHDDGDDEEDGIPYGEATAKGLLFLGLAVLVGAPITLVAVVSPATRRYGVVSRRGVRRARFIVYGSALLVVGAVTILGLYRIRGIPGDALESTWTFLGTSNGRVWLVQLLVAVATVGAVRRGLGRDDPRRWLGGAVASGVAIAFTVSWSSHSATLVDRVPGLLVDLGHVVGGATWVGGLVVMGLVVPPYLQAAHAEHTPRVAARATALFSVIATVGVTTVVVTGLLLTAWHVPDVTSLLTTTYGTVLSAKLVLVLVAIGLGGFNRMVLLRRLDSTEWAVPILGEDRSERVRADGGPGSDETVVRFVRSVRIEAVLLVGIVLIAGVLTSAPTAAIAAGGQDDGLLETEANGIEVVVDPTPSRIVGGTLVVDEAEPVVFDVTVLVDGDPVSPDDGVTMFLRDQNETSMELELEPVGSSTFSVVQTIPSEGRWDLRIETTVEDTYLVEWFHFRSGNDGDAGGTSIGGSATSQYEERSMVVGLPTDGGVLPTGARFGAVLVGVLGTIASLGEARRSSFLQRAREQGDSQQYCVDDASITSTDESQGGSRRSPRLLREAGSRLYAAGTVVLDRYRTTAGSVTARLRNNRLGARLRRRAVGSNAIGRSKTGIERVAIPTDSIDGVREYVGGILDPFIRWPFRPTTEADATWTSTSGYDVNRVVELASSLEPGDRVRLARVGYVWVDPLTVVDSETTLWLDEDGSRRFATTRVRLTTGRAGANVHVVETVSGRDRLPTWRQGERSDSVTRFELAEA